uniref:hypothetical protein n=1 Tax=Flavobacterium sp. TaxID=239 RepID=UPI00404A70FC
MIRVVIFIVFFALFVSCDDGDFNVDSFDFTNSTTQSCNAETNNFFIYRLSSNEALIIRIPESTFYYDVTPDESPIELDLLSVESSNIEVIYRLYNGAVSSATLCSFLPPVSPNVIEEWNATSGDIRVVTNVSKTSNTSISSENATKISGYNHEIEFRNITFLKPDGTEQFYDILNFGSFQNSTTTSLANFSGLLLQCNSPEQVLLYKSSGNQVLFLDLPTNLFPDEITPVGQPRVAYFDDVNSLNYLILEENLQTSNSFCENDFSLLETWIAQNGDATAQTGVIEITTIQSSEGFEHTVVLKKAIMEKGTINFTFGDAFTFGTFILN